MDSHRSLYMDLQEINAKISTINKRYIGTITRGRQGLDLSDLSQLLDGLQALLNPMVREVITQEPSSLGIPYDIISQDAVIDVFISYNSFDPEETITPSKNMTIYPLNFPYSGVRGPRREVEEVFKGYLARAGLEIVAFILGNQPLNISPSNFKPTTILKSDPGLNGAGTLIGIIDTGIDYTNPVFLDLKGETKIVSIWDQTIGNDSPYEYGTVYPREMINLALQSPDPSMIVPHKDEWGHGTMLAGVAAGFGEDEKGLYKGVAPGAELAVVKLKPANNEMQEFYHGRSNPLGFSALDIALAFQYLATLANQMQKPISICLPSGTNSGSHDGTNILDSIISSYSSNLGICSVLATGEEAGMGHHASGDLKEERVQTVSLTIAKGQPDFITEIWAEFNNQIEVILTSPQIGEEPGREIVLNNTQTYKVSAGSFVQSQGIKFDIDTGCPFIRFRLKNPIEGKWTITVKAIGISKGAYHIWIPKTGMILPGTVLSPGNPFTTIYNASATNGIIAMGCYNEKSQSTCGNSGRGFTRDNRVSPDYIANGIDLLGPLPENRWGLISGTAPASAIAVGITSLVYENQLIQGGQLANTIIMKAILGTKVKREPTVLYPNPSSGYGLIDINSDLF